VRISIEETANGYIVNHDDIAAETFKYSSLFQVMKHLATYMTPGTELYELLERAAEMRKGKA
jgi:hypothetical protein